MDGCWTISPGDRGRGEIWQRCLSVRLPAVLDADGCQRIARSGPSSRPLPSSPHISERHHIIFPRRLSASPPCSRLTSSPGGCACDGRAPAAPASSLDLYHQTLPQPASSRQNPRVAACLDVGGQVPWRDLLIPLICSPRVDLLQG